MGPPSHPSPMLPGTTNGDPAMSSAPGGVGVRPSMGSMPPGSGSPAVNPAMQPFAGGAPPGTAPQSSQQQQQLILSKMQQCMANIQKLQQMLTTGAPRCLSFNLRQHSWCLNVVSRPGWICLFDTDQKQSQCCAAYCVCQTVVVVQSTVMTALSCRRCCMLSMSGDMATAKL